MACARAPENPRQAAQAAPSEAQERADRARRSAEAGARERDYERIKAREYAVGPPPEVYALLAEWGSLPPPATRLRTAEEASEQLNALIEADRLEEEKKK